MSTNLDNRPLLGVVGPCASGKTTLVANLKKVGIEARHIAQEHSYVAEMWRKITNPRILVFLDVSYPVTLARRHLDWTQSDLDEQQHRLRHARRNADLYIQTDTLTPEEVFQRVLEFLQDPGSLPG